MPRTQLRGFESPFLRQPLHLLGLPSCPVVRLVASFHESSQGSKVAVKTQPRWQVGVGGWLTAWDESGVQGLDEFLQTDEGKRKLTDVDMEELDDEERRSFLARYILIYDEFPRAPPIHWIGEDPLVFERLRFKM